MLPIRSCWTECRLFGAVSTHTVQQCRRRLVPRTTNFHFTTSNKSCDPVRPTSTGTSQHREVIFSAIQPTGVPHLGNYLGTLKRWVQLQDLSARSTTLVFCIADLHAITQPQNPLALKKSRKDTLAMLLAIGLDPKKSVIFEQSKVRDECFTKRRAEGETC